MKNMYFLSDKHADFYLRCRGIKLSNGIYKLDNKVIKKYNEEKNKMICDDFSRDKILQFKDIDIDVFSFIKALVYTGNSNIHSTITEYVKGLDVDTKSFGFYLIDDVINAIGEIIPSVKKLSDLGICVNDVNYGNIIFDGKKIGIIDTAEYYYGEKDVSSIYEDNIMYIMDMIFSNIFYTFYANRFDTIRRVHKYFNMRCSEYEHFREREYLMNPVDTLIGIREYMENDFGVKLEYFSDCFPYIDKVLVDDFNSSVKRRIIRK